MSTQQVKVASPVPCTRRQRWLLFVLSKNPAYWDKQMTITEASREITVLSKQKSKAKEEFQALWSEATAAGMQALAAATPVPMIVQQHTNMLDDASPVKKQWFVEGGVCGFAWVNIKPGTSAFARWLVKMSYARSDSYYGGVSYWVTDGGQSMQRKEAYAQATAEELRKHGIKAQAMSRID